MITLCSLGKGAHAHPLWQCMARQKREKERAKSRTDSSRWEQERGQAGGPTERTAVWGDTLSHECLEYFGKEQGPCPRAVQGLGRAQPPPWPCQALSQPAQQKELPKDAAGVPGFGGGMNRGYNHDKLCLGELLAKQQLLEKRADDVVFQRQGQAAQPPPQLLLCWNHPALCL